MCPESPIEKAMFGITILIVAIFNYT